MSDRLRIVFSGMVAGDPHQGGATWAVLQYLLGLRALGHDVVLAEPVDVLTAERSRYFAAVAAEFGLEGRAALVCGRDTVGVPYARLLALADGADLLINVSGMLRDETLLGAARRRVFLDLDPAFNQVWHEAEGIDMGFDRHERFATVGLALGDAACPVPTCGRDWIPTLPPVCLAHWPTGADLEWDALTSVGNWRAYGSVVWRGVRYGQKAHSLRPLLALPTRADERFVLALAIHPDERADLDALAAFGWELVDPAAVAGAPGAYRRFVAGSRAEFGLAKSGYVESRCGWFSDRSAAYLASGRPVLAQETGFSRYLPAGRGLLAFSTLDEALAAIAELRADYGAHAAAARELAEGLLDSGTVLRRLLERVGAG